MFDFFETIKQFQPLIAASVAGVIAIWFHHSKLQLDKENFKRDLFEKFNNRFDALNERLISIESSTDLDFERGEKKSIAFDYINLCGEEYYWFSRGMIDSDVWAVWKAGMLQWYAKSELLRKVVKDERDRKAPYYNSDFLDIFKVGQPAKSLGGHDAS